MKKTKIKADKFFNQKNQIQEYNEIYDGLNFEREYPANKKRLEIFVDLLKIIKPKKILDAGCGNGMPMVSILDNGFNCIGFDNAPNMVDEAKKNLIKNGYNSNLVCEGNFESFKSSYLFDCILGMGAFYYSEKPSKTIGQMTSNLVKGGHLIFSLRNKLFDLVTLNNYTNNLLKELFSTNESKILDKEFNRIIDQNNIEVDYKKKNTIDSNNVLSTVHNPLTVQKDLLDKNNLKLQNLYFYHYHAYPPKIEHYSPREFNEASWKIEDPLNWKGYFLASGFIVDAIKIS